MTNYTKIIEWLYANDGKFSNKNEWRQSFTTFLKELLVEKKELPCLDTLIRRSLAGAGGSRGTDGGNSGGGTGGGGGVLTSENKFYTLGRSK